MIFHKQQHEALGSQMKTLTKEKKEKENFLIELELMNLNNVILLNSKKFKRKTIEVEKEKLMDENEC